MEWYYYSFNWHGAYCYKVSIYPSMSIAELDAEFFRLISGDFDPNMQQNVAPTIHYNQHNPSPLKSQWKCPGCGKLYTRKEKCNRHIKGVKGETNRKKCKKCKPGAGPTELK